MLQSPAAEIDRPESDYGLGKNHISNLMPYPPAKKGERTPLDLWRYAGKAGPSIGHPSLPMPFEKWLEFNQKQKPELMSDVRNHMNSRYSFSGETIHGATMSGGKPIMKGPVAVLPKSVGSYEKFDKFTPEEIYARALFPDKPLAHPIQTTAHMVFPQSWVKAHPEHERIDVDMDIPEEYLPEFPPPLFLTTHKELGDVTQGKKLRLATISGCSMDY